LGGAQVLPVGEENVDGHGSHLGDDDKKLELFEALCVVAQKVQQGNEDQPIPKHIGDDKIFAEGDKIVQSAVDDVAILRGDEVFRENVKEKIDGPAPKEFPIGTWAVFYNGFFHGGTSVWEWDCLYYVCICPCSNPMWNNFSNICKRAGGKFPGRQPHLFGPSEYHGMSGEAQVKLHGGIRYVW
jgi:hypothetical protein